MIIWFALCIPVVTAIFLLLFFRRKTKWWEFLIPLVVSFALISFFKVAFTSMLTRDTEYWGGWVEKAQYFEDWNEYIHQTCTRQVACGTDSDGHTIYCTEYYDCSYVEYHPEKWQVVESNGFEISIDKSTYEWFVKRFGTGQVFVDLHRHYHTNDGDLYESRWDKSPTTLQAVTTVHTYENKVQAASSVFNFPDVDTGMIRQYELYEYPKAENPFEVLSIFGGSTLPGFQEAEKKFEYLNATLGASKKIRIWILVFKDKPLEAGHAQEWYWKGGNKNELILTIGIDQQNKVQWAYPFSWTEVQQIKVETGLFVSKMDTLNLLKIADWIGPKVENLWVKKSFQDFEYLTVEPPLWAIITTFAVTLLVNAGISLWVIKNEFTDERSFLS